MVVISTLIVFKVGLKPCSGLAKTDSSSSAGATGESAQQDASASTIVTWSSGGVRVANVDTVASGPPAIPVLLAGQRSVVVLTRSMRSRTRNVVGRTLPL